MTSSPPPGTAGSARAGSPVTISEQGAFWVGVGRRPTEAGTAAEAAMYVQYQIPADLRYPLPVVMVHGGGGQGTDYLSTPDGRPGWATRFLQAGYAVYVVDRPGHGRSPYHPAPSRARRRRTSSSTGSSATGRGDRAASGPAAARSAGTPRWTS